MEPIGVIKNEHVKKENEYNCEPMDISEPLLDSCCEEGEISSNDEDESSASKGRFVIPTTFSRTYNNNSGGNFITGINILGDDENLRKLDRARRFAIPVEGDGTQECYKERVSALYRDLGIDKENERHYRFNAIHMRGTENMSTEDVFQYFIAFAPSHIEWLNDVSCNVVWIDDISTARALLNLSKRIKNLDKVHSNADPFEKEYKNEEITLAEEEKDDAIDAREIKAAIPPGFWRIGVPAEKSSFILLRYATRSDKKQKNAEQNSEYYKKYGNPHYGNTPGIISKSLRSEIKKGYKKKKRDERLDVNNDMYSSQSTGNKNPWEELAYKWGQNDKIETSGYNVESNNFGRRLTKAKKSDVPDLRISLMNKKENRKRLQADEHSDLNTNSSDAWATKQKIPRMKMYADDEEERLEKKNSKRFQTEKVGRKINEDLRNKINRKRILGNKYNTEGKEKNSQAHNESDNSEIEYLPNYNYRYSSDDSGDWALEQYTDLRESLGQNRTKVQERLNRARQESESEDDDDDDDDRSENEVKIKSSIRNRSPLQIEIDNDEYYQKR